MMMVMMVVDVLIRRCRPRLCVTRIQGGPAGTAKAARAGIFNAALRARNAGLRGSDTSLPFEADVRRKTLDGMQSGCDRLFAGFRPAKIVIDLRKKIIHKSLGNTVRALALIWDGGVVSHSQRSFYPQDPAFTANIKFSRLPSCKLLPL